MGITIKVPGRRKCSIARISADIGSLSGLRVLIPLTSPSGEN